MSIDVIGLYYPQLPLVRALDGDNAYCFGRRPYSLETIILTPVLVDQIMEMITVVLETYFALCDGTTRNRLIKLCLFLLLVFT